MQAPETVDAHVSMNGRGPLPQAVGGTKADSLKVSGACILLLLLLFLLIVQIFRYFTAGGREILFLVVDAGRNLHFRMGFGD